jgi:hypothetical protein
VYSYIPACYGTQFRYCGYECPPSVPNLSYMNPAHIPMSSFFSHLRLGLPSVFFYSELYTEILYAFIIAPMLATCFAQLTLLGVQILCSTYNHQSIYLTVHIFLSRHRCICPVIHLVRPSVCLSVYL